MAASHARLSRRFWGSAAFLLACLGIYLGWVTYQWYDFPREAARLPQALQEARAAGVPLTAAELETGPTLAPGEDGTALFKQLAPVFDPTTGSWPKSLSTEPSDWHSTELTLRTNAATLDQLRTFASKEGYDLHRDWDLGPDVSLGDVGPAKHMARALCTVARVEAHLGRFDEAARDLRLARRIAMMVGKQHALVAFLVQISIDNTAFESATHCLADAAGSEKSLAAFRTQVLEQPGSYDLFQAFRCEAYCRLAWVRNLDVVYGPMAVYRGWVQDDWMIASSPGKGRLRRAGVPPRVEERALMARVLTFWSKCLDGVSKDPRNVGGSWDALYAWSERESKKPGASHAFDNFLLPVFSQCQVALDKAEAMRRCTVALSRVLEWHASHRAYPSSLAAAQAELADPFDGKPLRYRADARTIRVWSIGPNHVDDGGRARAELAGASKKDFDVVASYPPVRTRN